MPIQWVDEETGKDFNELSLQDKLIEMQAREEDARSRNALVGLCLSAVSGAVVGILAFALASWCGH